MKTNSSFSWFRALNVWLLLLASVIASPAHEDNHTHARLTVASFLFLDQTYPADGALFPSGARGLARQGSIDEDDDPLYFNHFFHPKTGGTIDTSGFPFFYDEVTAPARAGSLWTLAIQQYRSGQTNNAFSNLGHIIHLLQDMTSPAHVHLDPHGDPRFFVPGEDACGADTDDFENWGYCDDHGLNKILDYVTYTDINNSQILPRLSIGLQRIFGNQPQVSTRQTGENTGYAFVRDVANKVYDFTSFHVTLDDTSHPFNYDPGAGELKLMFPSLIEYTTSGWFISNIGWSQGECEGDRDQAWWLDDWQCNATGCGTGCTRDEGWVYIENVGGGDGGGFAIPDNLRPDYYRPASHIRPWFQRRYNSPSNGQNVSNVTMLRIYGDVLYPAAVAYGAGLLQAFLDEAIMPKPITDKPVELTGVSARLTGRVQPAGEAARAWFEWGTTTNYGSVTTPFNAGAGQGLTNVSSRIEELALDTIYHCRIVSSNRFGVRHGTNQTFRTPGPPTAIASLTVTNNAGGGASYRSLIRRDGGLLSAINLGHTGTNLTVNGVTFVSTPVGNPSGPNWSVFGPNTDDGLSHPGIDDLFFSEVWGGSPCTLTWSNLDAARRYVVQIFHGEPRGSFATTFRDNTLATSLDTAAPVPAFALGNNIAGENPPARDDVAIITVELQGTTFFTYTARNTPTRGSSIAGFHVRDLSPPRLLQLAPLGNGHFQFSFTNQSSAIYEVLCTTNVALPVAQWSVLGLPVPLGGGLYQFTDTMATNHVRRFYLLREREQ